jgi:hypothetical protein
MLRLKESEMQMRIWVRLLMGGALLCGAVACGNVDEVDAATAETGQRADDPFGLCEPVWVDPETYREILAGPKADKTRSDNGTAASGAAAPSSVPDAKTGSPACTAIRPRRRSNGGSHATFRIRPPGSRLTLKSDGTIILSPPVSARCNSSEDKDAYPGCFFPF